MTGTLWNSVIDFSKKIESKFQKTATLTSISDEENWYNSLYQSNRFRRAHLECVDKRQDHKLYILHSTIFPHFNDPSPIWGFDIVCGANKITGAFHDFSLPGYQEHPMKFWWEQETAKYN